MPFVSVVDSVSGALEGGPTGGGIWYPGSSSVIGVVTLGLPKNNDMSPDGFCAIAGAAWEGNIVLIFLT